MCIALHQTEKAKGGLSKATAAQGKGSTCSLWGDIWEDPSTNRSILTGKCKQSEKEFFPEVLGPLDNGTMSGWPVKPHTACCVYREGHLRIPRVKFWATTGQGAAAAQGTTALLEFKPLKSIFNANEALGAKKKTLLIILTAYNVLDE